jgi:hypothetical protein
MYDGVAFGNNISPLCRIARRILSICANSASCERLFSMFGLILTRLRSRLRTKALSDLAELRLHLRDEHLRLGSVKTRLQRNTTTHVGAVTLECPSNAPELSTTAQPVNSHQSEPESDATEPPDSSSLTAIAGVFMQQVDDDEDLEDEAHSSHNGSIRVTIAQVFDFSNVYWTTYLKSFAFRSLNDELELYELIESSGAGDELEGPEMDEMGEASLL